MPETVDAKGHLEAILRVRCPGPDAQACITHDSLQRGEGASGKLPDKRADRGQGRQIQG